MTAPKMFPVRFVIFDGEYRGKVVGTMWVEFGSEWIEAAEDRAGVMAREWSAEIDIHTGAVFPSGRVAEWDRAGIRVRP